MTTLEKSNELHLAYASKFRSLQLNSFVNSAELLALYGPIIQRSKS